MSQSTANRSNLDQYDRRILYYLQQDGHISNHDLALKVGLSQSPCSRRLRALEEAGVIVGKRVVLNRKALGLNVEVVLMVRIDRDNSERFSEFEVAVMAIPAVQECLMITGQEAAYMLKLVARDIDQYRDILLEQITRIDGVVGVHSSFVLKTVSDAHILPVPN